MRYQTDSTGLLCTVIASFKDNQGIKTLQLWEALEIHMNDTQFELAVNALTMSADNIKVAKMFLVEGKTAHELEDHYNISPSRLSKVLKRVSENYTKQLDKLNLVSAEYALDKKTARLVREIEASKINEARLKVELASKTKKKKPKTKRKKRKTQ